MTRTKVKAFDILKNERETLYDGIDDTDYSNPLVRLSRPLKGPLKVVVHPALKATDPEVVAILLFRIATEESLQIAFRVMDQLPLNKGKMLMYLTQKLSHYTAEEVVPWLMKPPTKKNLEKYIEQAKAFDMNSFERTKVNTAIALIEHMVKKMRSEKPDDMDKGQRCKKISGR
jgi:hypothetical protein